MNKSMIVILVFLIFEFAMAFQFKISIKHVIFDFYPDCHFLNTILCIIRISTDVLLT